MRLSLQLLSLLRRAMGLIRITSAESAMPRKILPIYPHYFHVEFIATKRNENGITIRYDTTLAFEDFPSDAFLKFPKFSLIRITFLIRNPFAILMRNIYKRSRFPYRLIDNVITFRISHIFLNRKLTSIKQLKTNIIF